MELRKKVNAYIIACMDDDNTERMDKTLFDFTGKELAIMDKFNGENTIITDYMNTKDPNWCMRFDIITKYIYNKLEINIKQGIRGNETELYYWYWANI